MNPAPAKLNGYNSPLSSFKRSSYDIRDIFHTITLLSAIGKILVGILPNRLLN